MAGYSMTTLTYCHENFMNSFSERHAGPPPRSMWSL